MRTNHRPGPVIQIGEASSVYANSGRVEPVNTNLGVNTNWGPGPRNTNWGPGSINTNLGPGPGAKQRPGGGKYKYPQYEKVLLCFI